MSDFLLVIEDLYKYFQQSAFLWGREKKPIQVINGVDLEISCQETVGLVGESGCGKSTLARIIMGLIPPSKGKIALEKNEFDKAINNFEVAKRWAQNDTNAISKATMALKRAKRLKGKKLYEEGVKEYKGGNYEIARTYFIRAESCGYKVDKDWFERINSQLAWKHYKLGRHHYRNEEYDKAVLEFQKALNLNPNLSVAKKWLKRAQYWANMTPRERMFEKAIREGKIMLGMTKEQVIRAWGKPNDINKMVFTDLYGVEHVHEQWRYGSIYGGYFLYFEDGILTSWQEY